MSWWSSYVGNLTRLDDIYVFRAFQMYNSWPVRANFDSGVFITLSAYITFSCKYQARKVLCQLELE